MVKAKKVFEREGTFLSFPLSPIAYEKEQLSFVSSNELTTESLLNLSEFSRLVNHVPSGVIWPPTEERYLWDVYDEVLKTAKLASSLRTSEEEKAFEKAFRYLHNVEEDGTWEDTPQVVKYNQYKDAWYGAQHDYNNKKVEADYSNDHATTQRWQEVEEPELREKIESIERDWIAKGFRTQVEEARHIEAALGGKSPSLAWGGWKEQFQEDLDTLTDTNGQRFVWSGFTPSNALDTGAWQRFTLSGGAVNELIKQAPAELRSRLAPNPLDFDIESLSFEYSAVAVTRPWLAPDVFKARFWKFYDDSRLLSDGNTPPVGICPAYVAALVFARKLEIKLKPNSVRNDKSLKRLQSAKSLPLGFFRIAAPATVATSPKKTALAGNVSSAPHKSILSSSTVAKAARALALLRLQKKSFTRILPSQAKPMPKDDKDRSRAEIPVGDDDEIFVMAFICKRLPRCPNPDSNLRWS
jgi:hypothetical protein